MRAVGPPPGPTPVDLGPTAEQRAARAVGALLLGIGLLCAVALCLGWVGWTGSRLGLHLASLAYVAGGCGVLLFGLAKLSGRARGRSEARGPWLVTGLLIVAVCGTLAASFQHRAVHHEVRYPCVCGCEVVLSGERNPWGTWLTRTTWVHRSPRGASPGAPLPACDHAAHAPE